jgi:ankyrin repeat protein
MMVDLNIDEVISSPEADIYAALQMCDQSKLVLRQTSAPREQQDSLPNPSNRDSMPPSTSSRLSSSSHKSRLSLRPAVLHRRSTSLASLMAAAAASGDAATIGRVLGAGGSVSRRGADGLAPLHVAAAAGQHAAVRCLARMGADVEARDAAGYTPLHRAVLAGRVSIIAHLANLGVDLDARVQEPVGATAALHLAAAVPSARNDAQPPPPATPSPEQRHDEPLRFGYALSSTGHSRRSSCASASSDSSSRSSINPDYAAPTMVEALLRAGARVDAVDANGETALHIAARAGHAGNVAALLSAGAAVNARSRAGATALGVLRRARGEKKVGMVVASSDGPGAEIERMLVERGGLESVGSEVAPRARLWGWRRRGSVL